MGIKPQHFGFKSAKRGEFLTRIRDEIFNYIKKTDKLLWFLTVGTSLFGIVILITMGINFGGNYYRTQIIALALGIVACIFLSRINYYLLANAWLLHVIICWSLVILTFFIGYQRPGTDDRAWFLLPGGFMFQPTELAKLSFALSFSLHLSSVSDVNKPKDLGLLLLHLAAPVILVSMQGDDGTALIFGIMGISMLFVAGLSVKYILGATAAAAVAAPFVWFLVLEDFHRNRILTIFNPDLDPLGIGWQQSQGKISIGSGQIFGKGLISDELRQISEVRNDFIFAYIAEALGIIGAIITILLILFICIRIFMIARMSKDKLGCYISVGVSSFIAAQMIINVAMCLGIGPVIGVTLPFLSSGGTSLSTLFLSLGLVHNIYIMNRKNIF